MFYGISLYKAQFPGWVRGSIDHTAKRETMLQTKQRFHTCANTI